jgi:hypothetical protein
MPEVFLGSFLSLGMMLMGLLVRLSARLVKRKGFGRVVNVGLGLIRMVLSFYQPLITINGIDLLLYLMQLPKPLRLDQHNT